MTFPYLKQFISKIAVYFKATKHIFAKGSFRKGCTKFKTPVCKKSSTKQYVAYPK